MNLATFVAELRATAPSEELLRSVGIDEEGIESILANYACSPRAGGPPDDSLASLVTFWDCSRVQIGGLCFEREPGPHPSGLLVAYREGDPIVELRDGRILCENHDDDGRHWLVGESAEGVLRSLLLAARFNGSDQLERRLAVLDDIAGLSGEESRPFWEQVVKRR